MQNVNEQKSQRRNGFNYGDWYFSNHAIFRVLNSDTNNVKVGKLWRHSRDFWCDSTTRKGQERRKIPKLPYGQVPVWYCGFGQDLSFASRWDRMLIRYIDSQMENWQPNVAPDGKEALTCNVSSFFISLCETTREISLCCQSSRFIQKSPRSYNTTIS